MQPVAAVRRSGAKDCPLFASCGCDSLRESCGASPISTASAPMAKYTTMREVLLAHSGEAHLSRLVFQSLNYYDHDSIIEFLKSLQILSAKPPTLNVTEELQWSIVRECPTQSGANGSKARRRRLLPYAY